jgi:topoisomerase-4 subunit A
MSLDTLDAGQLDSTPGHSVLIHHHAESAYLQYALATVKSRALSDVEDGQKPVQRRILYAMHQLA